MAFWCSPPAPKPQQLQQAPPSPLLALALGHVDGSKPLLAPWPTPPPVPTVTGPGEATLPGRPRNQNGVRGDSVLPCKVGQRPRLEGPHWSCLTHTHARPCRQGPEPRGQSPSTPHDGRASRRAGRTQLEAPVPSARLAALDSELESRKGTASLHRAGPQACGWPGIGPLARPWGPWRRGVWDRQHGSHAHTPAPATCMCMHAHQAHAACTGREKRASAATTVSNSSGEQPPRGAGFQRL